MRKRCDICDGRGLVRLPVHHRVSFFEVTNAGDMGPGAMVEACREYPCPECGPRVPDERIVVLTRRTIYDSRIREPQFLQAVRNNAAYALVGALLEKDFIVFEDGVEDDFTNTIDAKIGVVSKAAVNSLEERAKAVGAVTASKALQELRHRVWNWGSEFSRSEISKKQVSSMIDEIMHKRNLPLVSEAAS